MTSLANICLPVVIENDYWRVQRRLLQSLPEEICDAILAGLIRRGCVDFVNLGLFAHSCSAVYLSGRDIGSDARAWLRTLSQFSGLQTLHIEGADRLQEDALSMLAPLAATLQELSLQGCHALRDRAGQHLQALTRLTQLDIGGTQIPSGRVAGLRSLAVLSMHQGLVKGNSDHSFSQLENLEALDVSDTDMGNAELQQLQALSQLRSLNLTWTKVTRPPLVSSLTSLEMGNVEVAPTPEDLDWLEDNGLLLHLESLRIPGASLSQQGEAFVRTLLQCSAKHLTSLDVRQVTASSADFLDGLPQDNSLHTLNISGCRGLHDLHLLRGMTDLRDLDLSQTDVSDSGLFRMAAMSQLTRLSLRDTAVTSAALKALADLSTLQSLDLSHTSIHNRIHQNLGAPAALCPRTLLAVGTKLSDRDVHALMSFAGRRLQNLHLGTSITESIYCLRTAVGLERLVLAGCNCITEEQLKSVAGLFRSLHSLTIHHCFLLTEHLAVDVDAWAPESLASLSIDDTPYYIEKQKGGRREAMMTVSPTKQPRPARRMSMEELQAYDERLRYSREEMQGIAAGLQQNGAACAALSQAVRSLDLAPAK